MIAFVFGAVIGIPIGVAVTLYAFWKRGILRWDDR